MCKNFEKCPPKTMMALPLLLQQQQEEED